jgi:hypothetical protein
MTFREEIETIAKMLDIGSTTLVVSEMQMGEQSVRSLYGDHGTK